jgi:hypothetical protein
MRMADLVFWADIILTILVPAISHERAQGMRIIITINVPVKKRSLKMRFLKFVGHCQIEEVGTSVPRGGRARVLSRGGTQSLPPINALLEGQDSEPCSSDVVLKTVALARRMLVWGIHKLVLLGEAAADSREPGSDWLVAGKYQLLLAVVACRRRFQ